MKRTEGIKTALIILLAISAAMLGRMTGIFNDLGRREALPDSGGDVPAEYTAAAFPRAAAYSASAGLRYGVKYSESGMEELYERIGAQLGEALGSASAPEEMKETAWAEAVYGSGLFLDYGSDIPLEALARWMGTVMREGVTGSASRLMFSPDGTGGVKLAFQSGDSFYSCATMSRWSSFTAALGDFLPNGAAFAFEKDSLKNTEKYALILEEMPKVYFVQASTWRGSGIGAALDMSMANGYAETDGSIVYPEDNGILKLGYDGTAIYTAADRPHIRAEGTAAMIEKARSILEEIHAEDKGDETLYFSGLRRENGTLRLSFDYYVDGIRVLQSGDSAAWVEFENDSLTSLYIKLRSYRLTEREVQPLPELQAMAAAAGRKEGSSAVLAYFDAGADLLRPRWTAE